MRGDCPFEYTTGQCSTIAPHQITIESILEKYGVIITRDTEDRIYEDVSSLKARRRAAMVLVNYDVQCAAMRVLRYQFSDSTSPRQSPHPGTYQFEKCCDRTRRSRECYLLGPLGERQPLALNPRKPF